MKIIFPPSSTGFCRTELKPDIVVLPGYIRIHLKVAAAEKAATFQKQKGLSKVDSPSFKAAGKREGGRQ